MRRGTGHLYHIGCGRRTPENAGRIECNAPPLDPIAVERSGVNVGRRLVANKDDRSGHGRLER